MPQQHSKAIRQDCATVPFKAHVIETETIGKKASDTDAQSLIDMIDRNTVSPMQRLLSTTLHHASKTITYLRRAHLFSIYTSYMELKWPAFWRIGNV